MFAAKSHESGKSKADPAPDKTRGGKDASTHEVEVNPVWGNLATHVSNRAFTSSPNDLSPIQRMCAECEEEVSAENVPSVQTAFGKGHAPQVDIVPHLQPQPTNTEENQTTLTPLRLNIFQSGSIQAKLEIGRQNDPFEREADEVADQVMRMPLGGAVGVSHHETVSTVQTKSKGANPPSTITPTVQGVVNSPGIGSPLSKPVRSRVEPVLGVDLSHVSVHTDGAAQQAAGDINAKAFTNRSNVYLGAGQSENDVELMAHESTHVVQQNGCRLPLVQRQTDEEPLWEPEEALELYLQEFEDVKRVQNESESGEPVQLSDEGPNAWMGDGAKGKRKYLMIMAEYINLSDEDYKNSVIDRFTNLDNPGELYIKSVKESIDSVADNENNTLEFINGQLNLGATAENFIDIDWLKSYDGANAFPDFSWKIVKKLISPPENLDHDINEHFNISKRYYESYWDKLAIDMYKKGLPVSYVRSLSLDHYTLVKSRNIGLLKEMPDQKWMISKFILPAETELNSPIMKECVTSFAYYGVSSFRVNILDKWKEASAQRWYTYDTRAISDFRKEYPTGFNYLDQFYKFEHKGAAYVLFELVSAIIFQLEGVGNQSPYTILGFKSSDARNLAHGNLTSYVKAAYRDFDRSLGLADGMINNLSSEDKLHKSIKWSFDKGFAGESINILLEELDNIVLDIIKEMGKEKAIKKATVAIASKFGGPLGAFAGIIYHVYTTYKDTEDLIEIAELVYTLQSILDEARCSQTVIQSQQSAAKLAETTVSTIPMIIQILGSKILNNLKNVAKDKIGIFSEAKRNKLLDESHDIHSVADLKKNPARLDAELDTAALMGIKKSTDSDYEVEAILPNGHLWRRNAKGVWCRFSLDAPTCILSLKDVPENTRNELEQLNEKAEKYKEAKGAEDAFSKEDFEMLSKTPSDYPPGYNKVHPNTTLGTFMHSSQYTQFIHWLDLSPGRQWLDNRGLTHADFVLDLPSGNIIREFTIEHPYYPRRRKPRADVVNYDNALVHEIKPEGLEHRGFTEAQQYAQWMNKYHKRGDGLLWRAGPTLTYDGQSVMNIFRDFGYFERE